MHLDLGTVEQCFLGTFLHDEEDLWPEDLNDLERDLLRDFLPKKNGDLFQR